MSIMKFPNNLKAIRVKNKVSQPELAAALKNAGISNPTKQRINKVERGEQRITAKEAVVYANYFKCDLNDILAVKAVKDVLPADDPVLSAMDFERKLIELCRAVPENVRDKVNMTSLLPRICEALGRECPVQETKKPMHSSTHTGRR